MIISMINFLYEILWENILPIILLISGILLTIFVSVPQIPLIKHILKYYYFGKFNLNKKKPFEIHQYHASCISLGGIIGLSAIFLSSQLPYLGGPGILFWLWIITIPAMTLRMISVTISRLTRSFLKNGDNIGGPMIAMRQNFKKPFSFLGILFAIIVILCSISYGNLLPTHEFLMLSKIIFPNDFILKILLPATLIFFTLIFTIFGTRIMGRIYGVIIPILLLSYGGISTLILLRLKTPLITLIKSVFLEAFNLDSLLPGAAYSAFFILFIEISKVVFLTTESGAGVASIIHSKTRSRPTGEGLVSMFGPLLNVLIISSFTFLVVLSFKQSNPSINSPSLFLPWNYAFPEFGKYYFFIFLFLFVVTTIAAWAFYGYMAFSSLYELRNIKIWYFIFAAFIVIAPYIDLSILHPLSNALLGLLVILNLIMSFFLLTIFKKNKKKYLADMKAKRF